VIAQLTDRGGARQLSQALSLSLFEIPLRLLKQPQGQPARNREIGGIDISFAAVAKLVNMVPSL